MTTDVAMSVQQASASAKQTVDQAVARARAAANWWSQQPVKERCRVLRRYRDLLVEHMDEIVAVVGREVNKPRFDVVNEILQAALQIGYLSKQAPKLLRPQSVSPGLLLNKKAVIEYRPLGVVGIITPWNYPVILTLSPLLQALAAGNTVVLKPSERAVEVATLLHRIFEKLELEHCVFELVPGEHAEAIALAGSAVDKIAFTGGTGGGKAILRAAANNLTPVLLELGGNDPMIVLEDADIERAANAAVWGAFLNCGQSCIAVERCYVARPIVEPFTRRVVELTRSLSQGLSAASAPEKLPQADWDHDVGPLASPEQFRKVRSLVEEAVEQGARVLAGGVPELPEDLDDPAKRCFPPTVLVDVDQSMTLMQQEVFGPVLPIIAFDDIDQAVTWSNDSPYGLSASVWSRDMRKAKAIADRLHAGGVVINDCLVHFAINSLPFGGVKQSGIGRSAGAHGLYEFCAVKTVTTHRIGPRIELQWFPYRSKHRLIARILRWFFARRAK